MTADSGSHPAPGQCTLKSREKTAGEEAFSTFSSILSPALQAGGRLATTEARALLREGNPGGLW